LEGLLAAVKERALERSLARAPDCWEGR
jgi:hypothetical protein